MNYDCILFDVLNFILFYFLLSTLDTGRHYELQVIELSRHPQAKFPKGGAWLITPQTLDHERFFSKSN